MTTIANPTARSCNLHSLEETFFNADIMPDVNKELRALHEADPDGRVTVSEDQVMTFMTTGQGRSCKQICWPPGFDGLQRVGLDPGQYDHHPHGVVHVGQLQDV